MRIEDLTIDPSTGMFDVGVSNLGSSVPWLQSRLQSAGVAIHPRSRLAVAMQALQEATIKSRTGETLRFRTPADAQRFYLQATGADFLAKALHWGHQAGLQGFDRHFQDLRAGDPLLTGPASKSSNETNGTWELLLASLVATFASNVRAGEPDVVCDFKGDRVGIAAKVLYSRDAETQLDRIQEGATQIERSDVDVGFVAVNLVEQFPHERMFANFLASTISHGDDAHEVLNVWVNAFLTQYQVDAWARHLRGKQKLLSLLFFLPTVVHMHGLPMPMVPYYQIHPLSIAGRQQRAEAFEVALSHASQSVLTFDPDKVPRTG